MDTNTEQWTKDALSAWLEEVLSRELQIPVRDIRDIKRFDALGVDSLLAAYLAAELTTPLGRQVNIDMA